jgi:hypothetical protein
MILSITELDFLNRYLIDDLNNREDFNFWSGSEAAKDIAYDILKKTTRELNKQGGAE